MAVKHPKFRVCFFNADGTIREERLFKTYKDIAEELNMDYHAIRYLNWKCDNEISPTKFLHGQTKAILDKMQIHRIIPE
jgi:hypothetical protein